MEPALDPVIAKALAHPLRARVLVALSERVASPNEIARELGEPLGRVSHHFRVLAKIGTIELVETRPRRGAVEHFYRATIRPVIDDASWAQLPIGARRSLAAQPLRGALHDAADAATGSGFDDALVHVSRTLLELDREAREQVAETLAAALDRVLEIQAQARERADVSELEPTELVMLHFDRESG